MVVLPHRGATMAQTTRLDRSGTAKIKKRRNLRLQLDYSVTFFRGMVEVKVKGRECDGELLSIVSFELLSGVFKN